MIELKSRLLSFSLYSLFLSLNKRYYSVLQGKPSIYELYIYILSTVVQPPRIRDTILFSYLYSLLSHAVAGGSIIYGRATTQNEGNILFFFSLYSLFFLSFSVTYRRDMI